MEEDNPEINKENKENEETELICKLLDSINSTINFSIITQAIIFIGLVAMIFVAGFYFTDRMPSNNLALSLNTQLDDLLKYEISHANLSDCKNTLTNETRKCNCLDYATYYNKTLTEKYARLHLEIIWPQKVDICNNLTICDSYHTYLIVNGFGAEAILDQKQYAIVHLL